MIYNSLSKGILCEYEGERLIFDGQGLRPHSLRGVFLFFFLCILLIFSFHYFVQFQPIFLYFSLFWLCLVCFHSFISLRFSFILFLFYLTFDLGTFFFYYQLISCFLVIFFLFLFFFMQVSQHINLKGRVRKTRTPPVA